VRGVRGAQVLPNFHNLDLEASEDAAIEWLERLELTAGGQLG
jgi:hypothetical protein